MSSKCRICGCRMAKGTVCQECEQDGLQEIKSQKPIDDMCVRGHRNKSCWKNPCESQWLRDAQKLYRIMSKKC